MPVTCPYCDYPDCDANFVDIGVGMQQCGPYGCERCHATQIGPYDDTSTITEREREIGWYAPDEPPDANAAPAPKQTLGLEMVTAMEDLLTALKEGNLEDRFTIDTVQRLSSGGFKRTTRRPDGVVSTAFYDNPTQFDCL